MKPPKSFFRDPIPTEARMPLVKTCTLFLNEYEVQATTFNISYRGLGVELPNDDQGFNARQPTKISVEDVGVFNIAVRWQKNGKLGLRFLSKKSAKPELNAYFKKIGSYPV